MKIANIIAMLEKRDHSFYFSILPLLILETTDDSTNPLILFLAMNHRDHHRSVHPCGLQLL